MTNTLPQPPCIQRHDRLAAIVVMTIATVAASVAAQTFTNPVVPRGGDPWATQWKGQYFYTSTTGGDVRIARSPWLQNLSNNSRAVWDPPAGTPYSSEIWAPELHRLDGKWYIYVAADDGADANHRMFVLEGDSQDPQGSYTLKGQISIPDNRWAIDGTVLEHAGKRYFIWSGRRYSTLSGTDTDNDQSLYIAEMVNPWTLTGTRSAISHPTRTWERYGHPVNEGPTILKHGSDVFLTYSASGFYTPQYAIGALKLTGANPLSITSWTKHTVPLFDQGNGVEGTGHASFVKSPDGTEDWIVYHARTTNDAPRDVRIQPFTWGTDGLPQFGDPVPTGQPIAAPSGVPLVTFIPNLSFERGGAGWLDDFHASGEAGVMDNDGSQFAHIAGGDGPRVGYLGAGSGSAIYQDLGPVHAGTYTLSIGLALSSDQLEAAADHPGSFLLRLESIGRFSGGAANEADQALLAETVINSDSINSVSFKYFDVTAIVPDGPLVGSWLRVELLSSGGFGTSLWQVKLDSMTLSFSAVPSVTVPEPAMGTLAGLMVGIICVGRRTRFQRAGRSNYSGTAKSEDISCSRAVFEADCIQLVGRLGFPDRSVR